MSTPIDRPNILWIFGDQYRGQSMSCAGDPNLSTPTMDRMATEGLRVPGAIANNPWCCPFRYSLLTGRYAHHGVCKTPMALKPDERTVAHHLGAAGYRTHYIGKWHLAHSGSTANEDRCITDPALRGGFHSWLGYENNNSQYQIWLHGHDEHGRDIATHRLADYETDGLTGLFLDRIRQEGQRQRHGDASPFFAVLSVQPPHRPCVAPRADMARHRPGTVQLRPNVPPVPWVEELARSRLAGYHAQIENLDAALGRILDTLASQGLLDNTEVFFFSDHGDCMGSHGCFEKSMPWEESIRIPFLWGGRVPYRGRRSGLTRVPLSGIDIAPTTLGLAGLSRPELMDGFDWSGLTASGPLPSGAPDSVYIQQVVRKSLVDGIDRAWRGVVTADGWKYVCIPHAPLHLFNLNDDPYERCNLAFNTRFMNERRRLHERLTQWIADTDDRFELPEL